jgi:broad-specificity NMP kinase
MKKLIFINGTMGVGKTTISQQLKQQLPYSVFLDGDWCWDASPFVVTEETKTMVIDNIVHLLNNFLKCQTYETVIFCWVMDEQEIIDSIVSKLSTPYQMFVFSLICSKEALVRRLKKDIDLGIRKEDVLERSIEKLSKYQLIESIKLDVSNMNQRQVAMDIITAIENHSM